MGHGGKPWVSNINDPNYVAGRKAMKTGNYEYSCFHRTSLILNPSGKIFNCFNVYFKLLSETTVPC